MQERFSEDLRRLAEEAFELADQTCGSCKNFHMLWPYLRLAGASGGRAGVPLINSVLKTLLSNQGRKILIAGCADTGLLALVARAATANTEITVLDRCKTPIELCRRFANRWALAIEALHQDLTELAIRSKFDVVFAHMLLHFLPADRQLDVLSRLRHALQPDGRLVIAFRTSPPVTGACAPEPEHGRDRSLRLIEQLERLNIPLPASCEAFRRCAEAHFEERRARAGSRVNRADVGKLIAMASFEIEDLTPIDSGMSEPFYQLDAKIGSQRFLVVARPNRASLA